MRHKDSRTWRQLLRSMQYPLKKDSIMVEQAFITKKNSNWLWCGLWWISGGEFYHSISDGTDC